MRRNSYINSCFPKKNYVFLRNYSIQQTCISLKMKNKVKTFCYYISHTIALDMFSCQPLAGSISFKYKKKSLYNYIILKRSFESTQILFFSGKFQAPFTYWYWFPALFGLHTSAWPWQTHRPPMLISFIL